MSSLVVPPPMPSDAIALRNSLFTAGTLVLDAGWNVIEVERVPSGLGDDYRFYLPETLKDFLWCYDDALSSPDHVQERELPTGALAGMLARVERWGWPREVPRGWYEAPGVGEVIVEALYIITGGRVPSTLGDDSFAAIKDDERRLDSVLSHEPLESHLLAALYVAGRLDKRMRQMMGDAEPAYMNAVRTGLSAVIHALEIRQPPYVDFPGMYR